MEVKTIPSIKLLETSYGTMWYHPEGKIIHHELHKFIFGDTFHTFLLTGTEAMKKYQATKWLSDDRKNPVLRTEDIEWGQVNWFPQTLQAGWKYWAMVQPESAIAQMNTKKIIKMYSEAGITAQYFNTVEEAMKWLQGLH